MVKKITFIIIFIFLLLILSSSVTVYLYQDQIKKIVKSYILKKTNIDSELKRFKALDSIKTSFFIENNVEKLFFNKAETKTINSLNNNFYTLSKYFIRFPPYVAFGDKPVAYIDVEDENIFLISGSGSLFHINKKDFLNKSFFVNKIKTNIEDVIKNNSIKESGVVSIRDIFLENKIIYISYVNEVSDKCYNTQILKANVSLNFLQFDHFFEYEECLSSEIMPWNAAGSGGRIESYDDNNLIFTIGDYIRRGPAQADKSLFGKIILINKHSKNFKVLSKGHRNPQGIYYDKNNNVIISTEHGPKGGDEININKNLNAGKIKNFGWPIASYGTHYKNDKYPNKIQFKNHKKNGFEEPLSYYTPAIGISQIIKVNKNFDSEFINDYFIGAMGFDINEGDMSIHHIRLNNQYDKIIYNDIIYVNDRIRDLKLLNSGNAILMILENEPAIAVLTKNKK